MLPWRRASVLTRINQSRLRSSEPVRVRLKAAHEATNEGVCDWSVANHTIHYSETIVEWVRGKSGAPGANRTATYGFGATNDARRV